MFNRTLDVLQEEQNEDEQLREYVRKNERSEQRTKFLIALLFVLAVFLGIGAAIFKIAAKAGQDTRI
jgi:hypothetical protein